MEEKKFKIDDLSITVEKLAEHIEDQLKLMTVGRVVQLFRSHTKLDLLGELLPFLSKGNQLALEDALEGKVFNLYY